MEKNLDKKNQKTKIINSESRLESLIKVIVNYFNHYYASKNINKFPQLATFAFDHIALRVNLYGIYEKSSLDLISKIVFDRLQVSNKGIILDVGANIGNHSIYLSSFATKVYSFEPNPKVFRLLEYNALNKNIIPLNYGLSDSEGSKLLYINKMNLGASSLEQEINTKQDIEHVTIKTIDTLDFLFSEKITLIKIDVEGHEISVLRGGENLIRRCKPVIIFEQQDFEINSGTSNSIEFLKGIGYRFYVTKEKYYIGKSLISKIISLILKLLFGFNKYVEERILFEKKFYDLIIAVYNNEKE
jgi:FkbM family methyltransferase